MHFLTADAATPACVLCRHGPENLLKFSFQWSTSDLQYHRAHASSTPPKLAASPTSQLSPVLASFAPSARLTSGLVTTATTAMLMQGAVAVTDCTPTGVASPSLSARCRLGPAGGYAGKRRRPRPSKRAPTTYISTDAATFRDMVQRVTGADEADPQPPHLGVERFLQAAGHAAPHVAAAPYTPASPAAAAEQQPLYPTLDSWNVMYGKKTEVVSALTGQ
jgi:hypothetical protein